MILTINDDLACQAGLDADLARRLLGQALCRAKGIPPSLACQIAGQTEIDFRRALANPTHAHTDGVDTLVADIKQYLTNKADGHAN